MIALASPPRNLGQSERRDVAGPARYGSTFHTELDVIQAPMIPRDPIPSVLLTIGRSVHAKAKCVVDAYDEEECESKEGTAAYLGDT